MKKVLLKLSGEALAGELGKGLDNATVKAVGKQVKEITDNGISCGIVIGGGNFWRGDEHEDEVERTKGDSIGMLATVMNCIYVSEVFRTLGMKTSVHTPFNVGTFTKLYSKDAVSESLENGEVVFFAGGTGHPYFSTDTATVLRALEIGAEAILMAKSIDGVYSADPAKDPDAVKYDRISIDEVVNRNLKVIDQAAAVLVKDNKLPLYVFGLGEENSIVLTAGGGGNGTVVDPE